jgi:hypothetical protein
MIREVKCGRPSIILHVVFEVLFIASLCVNLIVGDRGDQVGEKVPDGGDSEKRGEKAL